MVRIKGSGSVRGGGGGFQAHHGRHFRNPSVWACGRAPSSDGRLPIAPPRPTAGAGLNWDIGVVSLNPADVAAAAPATAVPTTVMALPEVGDGGMGDSMAAAGDGYPTSSSSSRTDPSADAMELGPATTASVGPPANAPGASEAGSATAAAYDGAGAPNASSLAPPESAADLAALSAAASPQLPAAAAASVPSVAGGGALLSRLLVAAAAAGAVAVVVA